MFNQIEANKRSSVILMTLCVVLLIALGWALAVYLEFPTYLGIIGAVLLAIILGLVSYYSGDSIVLATSGAQAVSHEDNPRLYNVVEEIALAAGVPTPQVYIIDDLSPNAFATGRDPQHSAVAITQGLLQKLNRDELQGVIAHEMSHVRNYDILFMTLMAVMVGTIALLSDIMWRTRWRSRSSSSSNDGGLQAILMILALALLILAPIAGKLIQLAASRKREYLADASGAMLTRYPAGLASALRKLDSDPDPLEKANRATQHMYIVNPLKSGGGSSLWDTHPPIEDRIKRLEQMAYINQQNPPTTQG